MTQTLTILDGGMGQELTQRMNTRGGLWSAQALVDTPELVREVHHDYLVAGARVLITNTYSTIPSYLDKADLGGDYLSYARQAGEIARSTADAFPAEVTVLGSIPPLEESFRPDLVPSDDEAQSVYRPLVDVLADYVDGYILRNNVLCQGGRQRRIGGSVDGPRKRALDCLDVTRDTG